MGPIAPKDPVKRRDFFYIMLEKQIFAAPAPEGRGVCFIYEDGGRLINSAKIVGNITDEEELKLLFTTEGFRKLVFGIGVSVMCKDVDGADFVFQMYGNKDTYGSGTTIRQHVSTDGAEYLIPLNEIEWSDDDKCPGQIRFEFEKSGFLSSVNVRFYLNDGFTAPPFEGLDPVDTSCAGYREMISHSLVSLGNTYRLNKVIEKGQRGEKVTFAFIGGSITQGAGATPINTECYTYKAYKAFADKYCKGETEYIKAGVGGTPSELGIVRYNRDVLNEGMVQPDILLVEFAVNDAGDETNGECYEGLVRNALNSPNAPAVILLFAVFADDYNLQDRLIPIGERYNLPMVSLKNAVTKQFYLTREEGRIIGKNRYFYDVFHPANIGHTVMADSIMYMIDESYKNPSAKDSACPEPLLSGDFENIELLDRANLIADAVVDAGSFTETDKMIQSVERNMDTTLTPQFPNNWMRRSGDEPFCMDINCRVLLIVTKDGSAPSDGCADIYVDGAFVKTVNPREVGWTHCNAQVIYRGTECGKHHVEVRMHSGDEDKQFTILGFGVRRS